MGEYGIRILREDGAAGIIIPEIQLNDAAALRSAKRVAAGKHYEVWKGIECLFRSKTDGAERATKPINEQGLST